uniref:Uncharacterized protein n=1 Tax=Rhizophora mucronata TaxID=61149 RepID=A0A2P2NUH1_RHIMU
MVVIDKSFDTNLGHQRPKRSNWCLVYLTTM